DQKEKLIEASKNMNDILKTLETTLRFQFHEKLEEYYVYRRKPDGPGY
ncbi:flagellar protein FlaG, partial [Halobacillus trueperi]